MKNIDIFQMYTGWDINGLADIYHDDNFTDALNESSEIVTL